jgi:hypothetical protein
VVTKKIGRPFAKGNTGRPKGAKNKLTTTVKETVLNVFNEIQDDPKHSLIKFAKKYPRDFYNIAARLIPTEIAGNFNKIQVTIVRRTKTGTATGRTTPGAATGDE